MSEQTPPIKREFTQAELIEEAKEWVCENYPADVYATETRMQNLGTMIDFVTGLYTQPK